MVGAGGRFRVAEEEQQEEEGKTRWEKVDVERKTDRGQQGMQGEERFRAHTRIIYTEIYFYICIYICICVCVYSIYRHYKTLYIRARIPAAVKRFLSLQ